MATKTPAVGAASNLFDQAYDLLKTLSPDKDPEELRSQAMLATGMYKIISDSSFDTDDFKRKTDRVTDVLIKTAAPENQALYRSAKKKFLKVEKAVCLDPDKEISDNEYIKLKEGIAALAKGTQDERNCLKCGKQNDTVSDGKGGYKYAIKRCGQCRRAIYCSVDCQRADWARHQVECIKK